MGEGGRRWEKVGEGGRSEAGGSKEEGEIAGAHLLEVREGGVLEGGRDACTEVARLARLVGRALHGEAHGGLETGEGEVVRLLVAHGNGQRHRVHLALARELLQGGAAAAADGQPEQPGHLKEEEEEVEEEMVVEMVVEEVVVVEEEEVEEVVV